MILNTILSLKGNIRQNDMRELIMAFFPYGTVQAGDERQAGLQQLEVAQTGERVEASFTGIEGGITVKEAEIPSTENPRQFVKGMVYDLLAEVTETRLKWGTMTGIRPVRIAHRERVKNAPDEVIRKSIADEYRLSGEALDLVMKISRLEMETLYPLGIKKGQVYINIPFCPSRCSYCSFITQEAGTDKGLLNTYLEALKKEMSVVGRHLKEAKWEIESVYVGGGTPTVLEPEQMGGLLENIAKNIPMDKVREFTFEGGRPDTITKEKVAILRAYGVDRISVNPQTLHDKTLESMGRSHDVESFFTAYEIVKEAGFATVNCDLILGLEGEGAKEMLESAERLVALEPENITVHSLSRKRSSRMAGKGEEFASELAASQEISVAASKIYGIFESHGYRPYYLYRQKYCVNNGENIGFAKSGHEGFYNMAIMSDKRTVIGLGAGSTGKVYNPENDGYKRMETVKNVRLYGENSSAEGEKKVQQLKRLFFHIDTK